MAVLTDDDLKPKSNVGAGIVLDTDEPEVAPEKESGKDATDEVSSLFCWAFEAENTGSISVRAET